MTNSPDSESSKVCPGHYAENFEPDHGCTVQCTADTSRSTAEGEAPDHQGREACLVSLTPTGLVDLLWNSLAQSSHNVVPLPPTSPISHSFKTSLLLFRNKQDGREDTSPALLGVGRKRRSGVRVGFSSHRFPRVLTADQLPVLIPNACGPGCPSQDREPRLRRIPPPGVATSFVTQTLPGHPLQWLPDSQCLP